MAQSNIFSDEENLFRWIKCCRTTEESVDSDSDDEIESELEKIQEISDVEEDDKSTNNLDQKSTDLDVNKTILYLAKASALEPSLTKKTPTLPQIYWRRYRYFLRSPKVHYIYEVLFYVIFLILFSYTLLCEFNFYEEGFVINENYSRDFNSTLIDIEEPQKIRRILLPALSEIFLIFWIFTFIIGEIFEVFTFSI